MIYRWSKIYFGDFFNRIWIVFILFLDVVKWSGRVLFVVFIIVKFVWVLLRIYLIIEVCLYLVVKCSMVVFVLFWLFLDRGGLVCLSNYCKVDNFFEVVVLCVGVDLILECLWGLNCFDWIRYLMIFIWFVLDV